MNQYLLSVHSVEGQADPAPEAMKKMYVDVEAVNAEMRSGGAWVFAGGLHPHTTASVVSVKDGEALITDGPFAEAKEHIAGFWVIKCEDLDAALAWAKKCSVACLGPVEVRPFEAEPSA